MHVDLAMSMSMKGLPLKLQEGLPPARIIVVEGTEEHPKMVPCYFRKQGLCVVASGECDCGGAFSVIIHEASGTQMSSHIHNPEHVLVALHTLCALEVDWTLSDDELNAALLAAPERVRIFVACLRDGKVEFTSGTSSHVGLA